MPGDKLCTPMEDTPAECSKYVHVTWPQACNSLTYNAIFQPEIGLCTRPCLTRGSQVVAQGLGQR